MSDIQVGTEIPALELAPGFTLYPWLCSQVLRAITIQFTLTVILPKRPVCRMCFAHGMLSMAYLGRMLTNWQSTGKTEKIQ